MGLEVGIVWSKVAAKVRNRLTGFFIRWNHNKLALYSKQMEEEHKKHLKGMLKHCGKGVNLNGRIVITGADSIIIGDNVHIGDNAFIRGEGGLEIGDNTHISRNLVLYTINHDYLGSRLPYDSNMIQKPVRIGRNAWIGMNVCIAPGTTIGDGAIIGIGTVVFGNVPPLAVVGSAPWRVIGERDAAHYACLDQTQAYGGVDGRSLDPSFCTKK